METILRKTIKSGNASAVVLPKSWLDKMVKVELIDKTPEIILSDVLNIVRLKINLSEIIGIYLVGSYSRREQSKNSDIDVLIITEKTDKEVIKIDSYEILIVSIDLLNYKLKENLFPIGSMLKEALPLLNSNFLNGIEIKVNKKNVNWYLKTTMESLMIIKDSIKRIEEKKPDGKLSDSVAYSLILRLRTLYIIDCLIKNKIYNKDNFIKLTKEISGSLTAYNRYIYSKDSKDNKRELLLIEGKKLYNYINEYLKTITNSLK